MDTVVVGFTMKNTFIDGFIIGIIAGVAICIICDCIKVWKD